MGNSCSIIQGRCYEDKSEILNDISFQSQMVKIPVFTRKLELNSKIDNGVHQIRLGNINQSEIENQSEITIQEQSAQFSLAKELDVDQGLQKKEESNQKNAKRKQYDINLKELCENSVQSQNIEVQRKEDEYEDEYDGYYDQIRENDFNQFKFQTIFIMKLVDKQAHKKG